jgi:hypothetical protein
MPHLTRRQNALKNVKPLLSSKHWRAMTPIVRAQQVQSDTPTKKRAHDLDLKCPGSTFTQVLKSHGKDGRSFYWPFLRIILTIHGQLALSKAIYSWNISLAMNRHILAPHLGHLASLTWAKLILGRFRDAVLPDISRFPAGPNDCLNH